LLKKKFIQQSKETINDYILDLNSKELLQNEIKLKLTEKEIAIIMYLFKKEKPIGIRELEKNVWNYQSNIETHTVETHIYRLRKKIIKVFNDEYFILSTKNGYEIKR
jgi:DNA-binding response OmpR family regulator